MTDFQAWDIYIALTLVAHNSDHSIVTVGEGASSLLGHREAVLTSILNSILLPGHVEVS